MKPIGRYQGREKEAELMRMKGVRARKKAKPDTVMKTKKKKSNQKPKLNITLHEDTKQKLTALAQLEKRSVSNLIEIMADERWEKLAEREGVDYAKTVAEIAGLKGLRADKEADRKVFRREILERVLKYKKR
jgi:hypothetical protein